MAPDPKTRRDEAGRNEAGREDAADDRLPAAGPHADPGLTDPDKTPGSGILPSEDPDAAGDATESPTG
ncbi:hypothetical protein PQJ75_03290 [Rhodoplanes sp. TEM]|uniref:Uncharacterized protein n=1 Tax=Rhodoplanes tepidamans TaxID=200616 RepID=A0ABT5JID8_RHOTP|nr:MULTISPECIES: hypothetical protein [Rhodoplanes]MDC7789126.1 hypothetical protein [Rhodoplanes tepidamans]MDC7982743.1 hypothetical protein [Rhodoplanes sp. TEM]MDQ0357428.1 hypothetical protein [Rhodoplanes tepidamans]